MRGLLFFLFPMAVLLTILGCSDSKDIVTEEPGETTYIGASECRLCHAAKYDEVFNTGHPYKLNKVVNGTPPTYPDITPGPPPLPANPPTGYTWNDVSYVIGGFGWKARFIDNDGYIVTGDAVQWNLDTQEWVAYHSSDSAGTKPYDCGRCHTTGYNPDTSLHQDGLPGMIGTWAEDGITCEACHGPGSQHILSPTENVLTIDRSSALCGECHYRSADHRILVSGGLIRHHEQYDEMLSAGHANLLCVQCHDPHKSAKYDAANAIIADCEDCHASVTVTHAGPSNCVYCHMPFSVKSAISSDSLVHLRGDIRSHIFKIGTDTTQAQFYEDGGSTYSNGFNGLNFACLSFCHASHDLQWAADNAGSIH